MLHKLLFTCFILLFAGGATAQVCLSPREGLRRTCARFVKLDADCKAKNPATLAWDETSCLAAKSTKALKYVSTLSPMAVVPKETFSQYPNKELAEALIHRHFQTKQVPFVTEPDIHKPSYDLYHDTHLLIALRAEDFGSILDKGFLNQFQTGRSSGIYSPLQRALLENDMIDLNLGLKLPYPESESLNALRPKYAYLTFDVESPGIGDAWATHQYGNVFARFKDSVKRRSTFTNADTLDYYFNFQSFANVRHQFQHLSFYSLNRAFRIKILRSYFEAQIWGTLDKDDIDYILVGCFIGIPDHKEAIIAALTARKLKIPVYSCKSKRGKETFLTFERDQKLYPL